MLAGTAGTVAAARPDSYEAACRRDAARAAIGAELLHETGDEVGIGLGHADDVHATVFTRRGLHTAGSGTGGLVLARRHDLLKPKFELARKVVRSLAVAERPVCAQDELLARDAGIEDLGNARVAARGRGHRRAGIGLIDQVLLARAREAGTARAREERERAGGD